MTPSDLEPGSPEESSVDTPAWIPWLTGLGGTRIAFLWGFMEGSFFFIVPDLILTITALFHLRSAMRQMGFAILGALVAGSILFSWASQNPQSAKAAVLKVPFVRVSMVEDVGVDFDQYGATAMLRGPASGIPYKLYAVEAPKYVSFPIFLMMTVPARLERLLISLTLFGVAGWLFRKQIAAHPRRALSLHLLYWIGIYAYYWSVI